MPKEGRWRTRANQWSVQATTRQEPIYYFHPDIKQLSISRDLKVFEDEACNLNVKDNDVINTLVHVHSETYDVQEVGTKNIVEIEDVNKEEYAPTQIRLQSGKQVPKRLVDCELVPNHEACINGEMLHLATFTDVESIDYQVAIKEQA